VALTRTADPNRSTAINFNVETSYFTQLKNVT